jgi:hypothetical protein
MPSLSLKKYARAQPWRSPDVHLLKRGIGVAVRAGTVTARAWKSAAE